ncbi:MAG: hypothetical protein LBB18_00895 [Puniceicoccales bacterium]|jgi:hypothetical protein|nr:hypothetical protein [Puniceicoccales bacterium]
MTQLILSNSAVGTHACNITKRAAEKIETKYLLGKFGSSSTDIEICGATDLPIGIITDEANAPAANGEKSIVNVALLGSSDTLQAVASDAILAGKLLIPAAGGKVQGIPTTTGTYSVVGAALTTATVPGEIIEFMSCIPQQHAI